MNVNDFRELLSRSESETLDFKREMYLFTADGKHDVLKDIISMANTPRNESSFIVIGVDWQPGSPAKPIGIASQIDDVLLRDQIRSEAISPVPPHFKYHQLEFEGKLYGVIELPPEPAVGPFYPTRDFGNKLLKNVLYVRNGSQNDRANLSQQRHVYSWFGHFIPQDLGVEAEQWRRFIEATDGLNENFHYVLIVDPILNENAIGLSGLCLVPWLAVLDFDPASETSGLLSAMRSRLQESRAIQMCVKGERPEVHSRRQTIWYFARGLAGRYGTEVENSTKAWIREYGREMDQIIEHLASGTSPTPMVLIVVWNDLSSLKEMTTTLDSVTKSLGDRSRIVVVTQEPKVEAAVEIYEATVVSLGLRSLSEGTEHVLGRRRNLQVGLAFPTPSGTPCSIKEEDRIWLEEELELVHLETGREGPDSPSSFRRGETVTWRDLDLRHDCDRSIMAGLQDRIRRDLEDHSITRTNLFHPAGAGGTTVARRVAWDLHWKFPTVSVHRLFPDKTAARLAKVASLTHSSVLCVVDGSQFRETELAELYNLIRGQQIPVVMLQVVRRDQRPSAPPLASGVPQRTFWLPLELDVAEAERFRAAYSQAVPTRSIQFDALSKSKECRERTAFYFGLTAYEREFQGLHRHVQSRISGLNDLQRRLVGYLALAHHYGQQALPAQCFATLLSVPRDRILELSKSLQPAAMELLVQVDEKTFRTTHNLVAEEILRQLLSPPDAAQTDAWKQQLSNLALGFLDMLRGDWQVAGAPLVDIAARVFVVRDNSNLLGSEASASKRFAQIIEDIPAVHGRLEVLQRLADRFPEEAHFYAHLGRFCGLNGRFDEAIRAIDHAIVLSSEDAVLHHMRGMTIRYKIMDAIDRTATVNEVIELAKDARSSFASSRHFNPENEHGYISEVQMLSRVLDYASKQAKTPIATLIYSPVANPFLREAVDGAEDLMYQLQTHRGGDRPSEFEQDCRAKLDALYGDHAKALQGWQSLLDRQDSLKPPIRRQIVWTLLNRSEGNWAKMRTKDADRCQQLLQENLEEQPNDPASLRLWLRAVRHSSNRPSLNSLIERIGYWKANTNSLESSFYLFVLNSLAALEGSSISRDDAMRALDECRKLARFRRDRMRSFEWVGVGEGIGRLVHQGQLGEWTGDFYANLGLLSRVKGRVVEVSAPQQGKIELEHGLPAFFVPAVAGIALGRDENRQVECFVGFSYDGLRAWQVQVI